MGSPLLSSHAEGRQGARTDRWASGHLDDSGALSVLGGEGGMGQRASGRGAAGDGEDRQLSGKAWEAGKLRQDGSSGRGHGAGGAM